MILMEYTELQLVKETILERKGDERTFCDLGVNGYILRIAVYFTK